MPGRGRAVATLTHVLKGARGQPAVAAPAVAAASAPAPAPASKPKKRATPKQKESKEKSQRDPAEQIWINLKEANNAAHIVRAVATKLGWRVTSTMEEDCQANLFW